MMNNEINTGSIQEISTNTDIREQILNTYFKPNVLKDAQHDIIRMSKIANEIEDLLVKRVKGKEEPTEKELTEKISSYSRTSKEIYDKNINSGWPFDVLYMYIIDGIQRFDDYKLDIEKVAETAREIYEKTNQKSLVVANFFDILFSLSQVQMAREETEKLDATIEEGKKLIEVTANVPLSTVINWIIEYLLEYEYSENDKNKDNETPVINFNNDAKLIAQWIIKLLSIESFNRSQYELLKRSLEKFKSSPRAIYTILKIYRCVEDIKYQLAVKDLSNWEFGHYTRGSVLQILLKQENNVKEQYKIEGKSRLYNVRYMNDPEEGKILDRLLGIENSNNPGDKVESSPWFLMSLTTAMDELTMWSQYGENAEGVCLVLQNDSFSEVASINDVESFTQRRNNLKSFETARNHDEKRLPLLASKEYLYRICYLDEEALKRDEIEIVELHNDLLKDKKNVKDENRVINKVKKSLVQIKEIIDIELLNDKEKDGELLYNTNKLLEEIRYLFKSSGYCYEKEIRLLKYSELNPNNTEIKVQNMSPFAKLYIERDTPIQIKKIIFGPKFKEPENVTPLVHLLDKDIICKRSSKKFK